MKLFVIYNKDIGKFLTEKFKWSASDQDAIISRRISKAREIRHSLKNKKLFLDTFKNVEILELDTSIVGSH